ncbi:MAG TPA: phosphatidate cytidylyltransferase [Rhizomicrobium sp.]|nr:phosphatidate cytidylyltransferase [Rhizomicrobium sp.]
MTSAHHHHAPGYRAIRWNMDWITRPLFGLALAAVAIIVLFSHPYLFAALVVAISIAAAWEWHRIVSKGRVHRAETAVNAVTVALAVTVLLGTRQIWIALIVLAPGAVVAWWLAASRHAHPVWHAAGILYLGLPALALTALRAFEPRGAMVIVGMFLIVWATDTGALIFGNLIGGPRMAPVLSPSKTWAGTIGGSLTAAAIFAAFIWFMGGSAGEAALFGFVFSIAAHAGDLFESFVKRRFGIKDSGSLIPGHGGVLDRMDSTLAASAVMALLVFVAGLNPLFGVAA